MYHLKSCNPSNFMSKTVYKKEVCLEIRIFIFFHKKCLNSNVIFSALVKDNWDRFDGFVHNFQCLRPYVCAIKFAAHLWAPVPIQWGKVPFFDEKLTLWRHQSRHIAPTDIYHIPNEPQFYTLFIKYRPHAKIFSSFRGNRAYMKKNPKTALPPKYRK